MTKKNKDKSGKFSWPCLDMAKDLRGGFEAIRMLNNANIYAVLFIENTTNIFISSLWQKVLNPYMLVLSGHDKVAVGNAITVSGFTRAIVGVFAGRVLIDKMGVDGCSAISGVVGFLGIAVNFWCMTSGSIVMIYVLNFVWAIYGGLANSCLETGWAKSVISEQRQDASGARQVLNKLTTAIGPIFTMVCFWYAGGSKWSIPVMTNVMLIGSVLTAIPVVLAFTFSRRQEIRQEVFLNEIEKIQYPEKPIQCQQLTYNDFEDNVNGIALLTYFPDPESNEAKFRVLTANLEETQYIIGKQKSANIKGVPAVSKCIVHYLDTSHEDQCVVIENFLIFLRMDRSVDVDRSRVIFDLQPIPDGRHKTGCLRHGLRRLFFDRICEPSKQHERGLRESLMPPEDSASGSDMSLRATKGLRKSVTMAGNPNLEELGPKPINLNRANVIVSCDVLNALASGMSFKFINLFLIEDYGVSPIGLLWVSVWQNLAVVFLTPMVKTLMKKIRAYGFDGSSVVMGIWFLALIAVAVICIPNLNFYVVVIAIIANSSLTSCTKAHNRAKLIDSLPYNRVAGYMVWDSLNKANQGGITIFGGQICSAYGYRGCFLVTFFIMLVRWLIYTVYFTRAKMKKRGLKEKEYTFRTISEILPKKHQVEAEIHREETEFGGDHHDDEHGGSELFRQQSFVDDKYGNLTPYLRESAKAGYMMLSPSGERDLPNLHVIAEEGSESSPQPNAQQESSTASSSVFSIFSRQSTF